MLSGLLPSVVLIASLLNLQCGTSTNEPISKEAGSQKQAQQVGDTKSRPQAQQPAARTTDSKCDFAAYAPISISHFYPQKVVKRVKPDYPPEAVSQGIQGWVMVKALVNKDGDVEKACATEEANELLQRAAEMAAMRWKFKPNFGFTIKGQEKSKQSTYVQVVLPFHFILKKADAGVGITVLPSR